eukprot:114693_1
MPAQSCKVSKENALDKGLSTMKATMKDASFPPLKIKVDILRDLVRPVLAASFIAISMIASLGGANSSSARLFFIFVLCTQMVPWLTFRSYVAHDHSFNSSKQRLLLIIVWCLIYLIAGNYLLYHAPHSSTGCWYEQEYVLQSFIAGITLNHNIRILAIIFSEDWFKAKGITTPTQAMFAFNAGMVMIFKQKHQDTKSIWKEKIIELFKIFVQVAIDVVLLKIGAHLYKEYHEYVDANPILYYELSAIYSAINVDYMVNRVMWPFILIYGGEMDFKYGMRTPVLSSSPRDFWRRETVQQREALNLGVFKPIVKKTGNYWLGVVGVFFGNYVVHTTFTAQVTFEFFGFYEWGLVFAVLLIAVGMELWTEKYLLKKMKMEYIKTSIFYKAFWLIVLHISMAIVVYIGVPKLAPLGLESSYYFLNNSW